MLSNDAQTQQLDDVFAALANVKRRSIVGTLSFRPATVSQLAEEYDLSLPSIHRHIRTLEEAGLIQRRKVGRVNFVALQRKYFMMAQQWMGQYHLGWGHDDESLENYIGQLNKANNNSEEQ